MSEFKRLKTSEEILEFLDNVDVSDDEPTDIIIIPPDVDCLTDEENVEDNAITHNSQKILVKKKKIGNIKQNYTPIWKSKANPVYSSFTENVEKENIKNLIETYEGIDPLKYFSLFFDDTVLQLIIDFSMKYAKEQNRHDFFIEKSELLKFLGIMILTGYHTLPQMDCYWSKDEDKEVTLVRNTMSRNKFRFIKKNLHLADNHNLNPLDKFSKLRPFFDLLNQKFVQFGIFAHNLSIDEEMVPYFGRHSCKMFIRGKPVRFGFKLWCLTSENGYLFQFSPYGGASTKRIEGLPLGSEVVFNLLESVENPNLHKVFFDNFFTSYSLMAMLREKGFFATGTVRENRIGNYKLKSVKLLGKECKGTFDFAFEKKKMKFAQFDGMTIQL
ncbi:piggyBac transposable element-derived protein 3-like [Acyrthosiphon pisum]|uniref:PiggyBac transposable element-derived protein domain-containing protein n=1 Tax=Acyrthosiphon pisum TaxID=7029 RepID=A0A8R2B3L8_ACYPI|nr:piggyBac transposable element-derived protein 3-like [Acyrthosiphon pisum]|eukprot:XP_008179985.1 PREDICTED: piggyBac transposable element-derived protein 3-like [Acyrthosiphon pisum]